MMKGKTPLRFRSLIPITVLLVLFVFSGCQNATSQTISISAPGNVLFCDEIIFLTASLQNGNEIVTDPVDIIWSSSDNSIATVDENGIVTPHAPGSVSITATLADNAAICDSIELTVGTHVESITLSESELTLLTHTKNKDILLSVDIYPQTAIYQGVHFESSDPGIVNVDENGSLSAITPGTATITVSSEDPATNAFAECKVTVLQGVESIALDHSSAEFCSGETLKLTAAVTPENANCKDVIWSSSDEAVATVSQDGSITAIEPGITEVRCTSVDGTDTYAACQVRVIVPVESLSIDKSSILLLAGSPKTETTSLICSISPENASYQEVTWVSSDEAVAIVDDNGTVKAIAPGTVKITAYPTDPRVADSVYAECTVTVGNAVKEIKITGEGTSIKKGSSITLKAEASPESANNSKVVWTSSNENILKVDNRGKVTAVGVGKAEITCTAEDGSEVSAKRVISVYQPVTSIKAKQTGNIVIIEDDEITLNVNISPSDATDKSIKWTSDNASVASVDSQGRVTAKKAGRAVITATTQDGSSKKCTFRIVVEPSLPITVESLGFGVYNGNLLGITVKNLCSTKAITNFYFDIELISYYGGKLDSSGSYSLGDDEYIGANSTKTIKRTLSGISVTSKVKITITAVEFKDGTYYKIPWLEQETWTFSR